MDFGKIIERIKAIPTTPRTEWPAAAGPAAVQGLYAGYIAIVAALPIIAGFIKGSLIGSGAFGTTVRTPIGMGIGAALRAGAGDRLRGGADHQRAVAHLRRPERHGAGAEDRGLRLDHGYEKTCSADGNLVHEAWDTRSKYGECSVVVGKRFTVRASGDVDSTDQLKQAVASIDLGKLESLKDPGVKAN